MKNPTVYVHITRYLVKSSMYLSHLLDTIRTPTPILFVVAY